MNTTSDLAAEALDRFLSHLVPSRLTVTITAQGAAGPKAAKEQWYGARHCVEPLPQVDLGNQWVHRLLMIGWKGVAWARHCVEHCDSGMMGHKPTRYAKTRAPLLLMQELAAACAEAAGLPAPAPSAQQQNGSHQTAAQEPGHSSHSRNPSISTRVSLLSLGNGSAFNSSSNAEAEALALPELHMPGPNWALPVDTSLPEAAGKNRQGGTAPGAAGSQGAAATATATATAAVGGEGSEAPETGPGSAAQPPHPSMLLDSPQLRLWHLLDLTWGIPKVRCHWQKMKTDALGPAMPYLQHALPCPHGWGRSVASQGCGTSPVDHLLSALGLVFGPSMPTQPFALVPCHAFSSRRAQSAFSGAGVGVS